MACGLPGCCKSFPDTHPIAGSVLPQTRALEAGIGIGRVVYPADVFRAQEPAQRFPPDTQQRTHDPDGAVIERGRRHAGEPRFAGVCAAGLPHQDGLRLIVGGMPCHHQRDAGLAGRLRQEAIARLARGLRQACIRFRSGPDKRAMGDAANRAESRDGGGFRGRTRAQCVVDGHRKQGCRGMETVEMLFEEKKKSG